MRSMSTAPGPNRVSLVPQEDFLFHLYRGSELLQENRVLEAKEELEFALTMQPLDPKGQELLGTVYFRVGLYPRAIQIYEGLANQYPHDVAIKVNLALCYLKTGQPEAAQQTLREAVELNPSHKRAWGYLGLALQKLGELEEAQFAFQRGGHFTMAKRLIERRQRSSRPPPPAPPPPPPDERRHAAAADVVFSELDTGDLSLTPSATPTPPPPAAVVRGKARAGQTHSPLVLPPEQPIAKHGRDVLLVRVEESQSFAVRLDALRVIAGSASTRALHRRSEGAETNEVLGGIGSPMVRVAGPTELVLAARSQLELAVLTLDDEPVSVLEDMLLAFDLGLSYENGRVRLEARPEADGSRTATEAGSMTVQLRGEGALVLELGGKLGGVPCTHHRPLLIRREWIVGWLGQLGARALPPAESPNGQRGLVGFAGDGTVLLCAGSRSE
jgi:uncharacterized protein (AIM24 family)